MFDDKTPPQADGKPSAERCSLFVQLSTFYALKLKTIKPGKQAENLKSLIKNRLPTLAIFRLVGKKLPASATPVLAAMPKLRRRSLAAPPARALHFRSMADELWSPAMTLASRETSLAAASAALDSSCAVGACCYSVGS